MNKLEEKLEAVLEMGWDLRRQIIALLQKAFKYEVKIYQLRHSPLAQLDKELSTLYDYFIKYEYAANDFVITLWENQSDNPRVLAVLEKHFNTLESQRAGLRTLLEEVGRLLGSHRSLAVNHAAIQIALFALFVSLILGTVSLFSTNEPILVYPPKY